MAADRTGEEIASLVSRISDQYGVDMMSYRNSYFWNIINISNHIDWLSECHLPKSEEEYEPIP